MSATKGPNFGTHQGLRVCFPDWDFRKSPTTDHWCAICQKSMNPDRPSRWVHLVDGGMSVLHPADEVRYVPDGGDLGSHPIGNDCARRLGLEWSVPSERSHNAMLADFSALAKAGVS